MSIYDNLNEKQKEAVFCTEGPLLILAGAGSGKTRVLIHRMAYLLEKGVDPYNILAITFTNKAAAEMRDRVDRLIGFGSDRIWVATFHSTCVRILRRFIDLLGYDNSFTIYDTDDQRTLMKNILKEQGIDPRQYRERTVLNYISSAKNELKDSTDMIKEAVDSYEKKLAFLYGEYQKQLKKNNALDFDDLIFRTVELFEKNADVLDYYQERFRYIMVDEYQDTNTSQFRLVELIASKYRNLCVVGDDDQSIYGFRGANIENILGFEQCFENTRIVKLEQNYRSEGNILEAANSVIKNNRGRKSKRLWTSRDFGEKVRLKQFDTAYDEADAVIRDIDRAADKGNYNEFAVLYRTNAQSRLLEERCIAIGIPYQLVGGVNFYQRREIKDILAYLKTVANGKDDLAFLRIINLPKRGIGASSIDKLSAFASRNNMSLYESSAIANQAEGLGKAAEKIKAFNTLIEKFRSMISDGIELKELIEKLMEDTGYKAFLFEEGEIEAASRLENIEELINKASEYKPEELFLFLEEVALVADIDRTDDSADRITLMTLHAAKGLEFPYVYLTGMEEGLFPSNLSIASDNGTGVEEERRLCYVGITRAEKRLTLTAAKSRMVNGETKYSILSRFVKEIPDEILDKSIMESPAREKFRADSPFGDGISVSRVFDTKPKAASRVERPSAKPDFGKSFVIKKADKLDYGIGDRVLHSRFGEGMVLDIKDGARDYEVTVEFDNGGIKRMLAGFAGFKKIEL